MAESKLTTVSGTGTQSTTQSPQAATGQTGSAAAQSGSVQPGTASSVLTSSSGIVLKNTPLTTVSLRASTRALPPLVPVPVHRNLNYGLLGISLFLCVAAIGMFWVTSRSAKNTTNYT